MTMIKIVDADPKYEQKMHEIVDRDADKNTFGPKQVITIKRLADEMFVCR